MKVLGMISGTSHDGIDVAVVDLHAEGDVLVGRLLHADTVPYAPELREHLVRTLPPAQLRYADVCELDTHIGQAFAEGRGRRHRGERAGRPHLLARPDGVPLGGGRTRPRHAPAGRACLDRRAHRRTGRVGRPGPRHHGRRPWRAARVADGRAAPGGPARQPGRAQPGRHLQHDRAPRRPGWEPVAFDIGPSNALIDAAIRQLTNGAQGYDADGRVGGAGHVDEAALADLLTEPYYTAADTQVDRQGAVQRGVPARVPGSASGTGRRDLVATLTALTARTVADAVAAAGVDTLVCSGGGCDNPTLMADARAAARASMSGSSATSGHRPTPRRRSASRSSAGTPRTGCRAPSRRVPARARHASWAASRPVQARCGCPSRCPWRPVAADGAGRAVSSVGTPCGGGRPYGRSPAPGARPHGRGAIKRQGTWRSSMASTSMRRPAKPSVSSARAAPASRSRCWPSCGCCRRHSPPVAAAASASRARS